ncbi:MAG: rhamnulokinase family protein [Candidatus Methylacidiphilales bacterium]
MQYVACDLGAGSGRVMLGHLEDDLIRLEEIHRFPDPSVRWLGSDYWQMMEIYQQVRTGLEMIFRQGGCPTSISCDAWGVDYVLGNAANPMLCPPFQYRDRRTDGWIEKLDASLGRNGLYAESGIQSMFFNTVYQLCAHVESDPATLGAATHFLGIGDFMNFLLGGEPKCEVSWASTTALYHPVQRQWSSVLQSKLKLPTQIFPSILPSGTVTGKLIDPPRGWESTRIVASCSHDTAAAVAAVPVQNDGVSWAYLSSGTWSLLGVELDQPLINADSASENYTNEVGFGHSIRFLKNISGLFLIQELKKQWAESGEDLSYEEITKRAESSPALSRFIDPQHADFSTSGNMEEKIQNYCRRSGQTVPEGVGPIARCVYESLALCYRAALEKLEHLTGKKIDRLHVVGGGCKNPLLNQCTANALGIEVVAGPDEATALGNVLIQALAMGHIRDLQHLRAIVAQSVQTQNFHPQEKDAWKEARDRYVLLTQDQTKNNS